MWFFGKQSQALSRSARRSRRAHSHFAKSRLGCGFETLEDRRLLAITANLAAGVLTITGDGGVNELTITSSDATSNTVSLSSVTDAVGGVASPIAGVTAININLLGDLDILTIVGSAAADTIGVNGLTVTYGAVPYTLTNVENLGIQGGANADVLSATGVSVTGDLGLFGGADGDSLDVSNLTVGLALQLNGEAGANAISISGAIVSGDDQTFDDPVTLTANTTITTASVLFNSTIDSDATPRDLTVNASVNTVFGGEVGLNSALRNLTVNAPGATQINGGVVTTTEDQIYNEPVQLGANTVLTADDVTFATTVNSDATARDLTIDAATNTIFGGAVGGISALRNLTVNAPGATQINGGAITTLEDQTFNEPVALGADTTLNGNDITFATTLNSLGAPRALTVNTNTAGITTFAGVVGGVLALASLETNPDGETRINGGVVITTGDQLYRDAVTLGANTTLTAANVTLFSTLNSSGGARDLTVDATTNTIFGGEVGGAAALRNLTINAPGATQINGGLVVTTQDQNYNEPVQLGADTLLSATNVTFVTTLNSDATARDLTVNATTNTVFGGAVGGLSPLRNLTINAPGATQINGGLVSTTEDQFYSEPTVLGADTVLNGNDITFTTTLNSQGAPRALTVNSNANGITTFNGIVGGVLALASLETNPDGETRINGGAVTTTGDQLYRDPVVLGANTTLTSGTNINFFSTLNSDATPRDLTAVAAANTIFGGAVGGLSDLRNLTVNALGDTQINGGLVDTTQDQFYNEPVTLGADATLNGNNITFAATVNSAGANRSLTVNTNANGITTFTGVVGGLLALASLQTNLDGETRINGGVINTTGDQTYQDPVTLGTNTTLTGNDITFGNTLNSQGVPRTLLVNTDANGNTTFSGIVGGTLALASLETNPDGETRINGGAITTIGDQLYRDPVVLGANTTLTSGTNINFFSTLNSDATARDLIAVAAANTIFGGAVGGLSALRNLSVTAPGATQINGGLVTTTQDQSYNEPVTLGADATLNGNDITFVSTVNSAGANRSLIVNTDPGGFTRFNADVGAAFPLRNLTTDTDGITFIGASVIRTFDPVPGSMLNGNQDFGDDVVLQNDVSFLSNTGNIAFRRVLIGEFPIPPALQRDVVIDTLGQVSFAGEVGGPGPFDTLTVTAGRALNIPVNVTVTNNISFTVVEGAAASFAEDISISTGATVQSTAGAIDIRTGDDFALNFGTVLRAATTLVIRGDFGSNDDRGANILIAGASQANAALANSYVILGGAEKDNVSIQVLPLSPVDVLAGAQGGDVPEGVDASLGDRLTVSGTFGNDRIRVFNTQVNLDGSGVTPNVVYIDFEELSINGLVGEDRVDVTMPALGAFPAIVRIDGGSNSAAPPALGDLVTITGTNAADSILVGQFALSPANQFQLAAVERLQVFGNAGNDIIANSAAVSSLLDGGDGDDTLTGADFFALCDVIFGGDGVDTLLGRGGDDFLYPDHDFNFGAPVEKVRNGDVSNGGLGLDVILALGNGDTIQKDPGDFSSDIIVGKNLNLSINDYLFVRILPPDAGNVANNLQKGLNKPVSKFVP